MTENVVQGPSAQWLRSRVLYPLVIIGVALGIVVLLLRSSASLDTSEKTADPIVIRSQTVSLGPISLRVKSEGTVQAAVGSALVAQVTGEVLYVTPNLNAGGRFAEGESLLRIDARDYESALASAEAQVERARVEAQFFDAEWRRLEQLSSDKMVSESQRRDAERAARVSEATIKDAEAQLSRARLDLERTHIRAPFNGRVSREQVDVGQFVQRGTVEMIGLLVDGQGGRGFRRGYLVHRDAGFGNHLEHPGEKADLLAGIEVLQQQHSHRRSTGHRTDSRWRIRRLRTDARPAQ